MLAFFTKTEKDIQMNSDESIWFKPTKEINVIRATSQSKPEEGVQEFYPNVQECITVIR